MHQVTVKRQVKKLSFSTSYSSCLKLGLRICRGLPRIVNMFLSRSWTPWIALFFFPSGSSLWDTVESIQTASIDPCIFVCRQQFDCCHWRKKQLLQPVEVGVFNCQRNLEYNCKVISWNCHCFSTPAFSEESVYPLYPALLTLVSTASGLKQCSLEKMWGGLKKSNSLSDPP